MKKPASRPPKPRATAPVPGKSERGTLPGLPDPKDLRRTVVIEAVEPLVDGGRYPLKREVGAVLEVTADIFKEGHDVLVASLLHRRVTEQALEAIAVAFERQKPYLVEHWR